MWGGIGLSVTKFLHGGDVSKREPGGGGLYLVLDEAVLIEPDVAHGLHLGGHHHSSRLHLLHAPLDGQEVPPLFVLDAEVTLLL